MKAILTLVFGMALTQTAFAAEFRPFPGATLNEQLTNEVVAELARARPRAQLLYGKPQVYTTTAPFDAVLAFYKNLGAREFIVPTPWTTGPHEEMIPSEKIVGSPPGGMKFNKAILVLDDAPEPFKSHRWVEISHPVAGKLVGRKIDDIEQLTSITYVNKQPLQ